MARFDDDAVCLRQWDWSETSQTVLLFTREHGLVRALAKGSRRPRSAFDGGLEPLTRGVASATGKPGAGLLTLTGWSLERTYPGIRRSYDAFLAGGVAADAVRRLFELLDPHPPAFDALVRAFEAIDGSGSSGGESGAVVSALAPLLTVLLSESGLYPELGEDDDGGVADAAPGQGVIGFSPGHGGLVAGSGAVDPREPEVWPIRLATVRRLRALREGVGTGGSGRDELGALRFLIAWVRYRTGSDLPSASMLLERVASKGG